MNESLHAIGQWLRGIGIHLAYIACLNPRFKQLSDTRGIVISFAIAAGVATYARVLVSDPQPTPPNVVISVVVWLFILLALSIRTGQSKALFAVLLGTSACTDITYIVLQWMAAMTGASPRTAMPVTFLYEVVMMVQSIKVFSAMPTEVRAAGYRASKTEGTS